MSHPRRRTSRSPILALMAAVVMVGGILTTEAVRGATDRSTETAPDPVGRSAALLPGLRAPARIRRDQFAVPTIEAASLEDSAACQGFLHAKDRFVQMDLLRRLAAGELAELLGPLALPQDRQQRLLRGRATAEAALAHLPVAHRRLVDAYTAGVNAGLAALEATPQEYRFLQVTPAPWRSEDCILVALAMCAMLNDGARVEPAIGRLVEVLPPEWTTYFASPVARWNAPVLPDPMPLAPPAIPSRAVLDVRRVATPEARSKVGSQEDPGMDAPAGARPLGPRTESDALNGAPRGGVAIGTLATRSGDCGPGDGRAVANANSGSGDWTMCARVGCAAPSAGGPSAWDPFRTLRAMAEEGARIGSNGWVVAGRLTGGGAILANDMHLPITVPNVWYRMSVEIAADEPLRLDGVSLPGVPLLVSGSNGMIAWGFTNVEGDFIDHVLIDLDPIDPRRYLVPGGTEPFEEVVESIGVRGGEAQTFPIRLTRWGPVVDDGAGGPPMALKWTALEPAGLNFALFDLAAARTVSEALDIAGDWRGPQQNVMVAGRDGAIGWTISGLLPRRVGFEGLIPVSWADGSRRWDGFLDGAERPRLENPDDGFIVTANQRTLPVEQAAVIGRRFDEGDRAHRIRTLLEDAQKERRLIDEELCAAMQLDTHSNRLIAWRDAILPLLRQAAEETDAAGKPTARASRLQNITQAIAAWTGNAGPNESAVGVIDAIRRRCRRVIERELLAASIAQRWPERSRDECLSDADRMGRIPASDERFLQIVEAQPAHLVPPSDASWDALLARLALEAAAATSDRHGLIPWGRVNASNFGHPLASALPLLATKFGIPAHQQPGHPTAVRVAAPTFGASDRLVVRPGHEEAGLIQIPAGQSADPTSPHYSDLHDYWRDGRPLPLRPGAPTNETELNPAAP